ncbi:hypothetical protein [Flammeovirga sp. SubArs3]|uniref:hypothetical protein n=1 Tax=Flammeovirga sp. SubArs3 TaxID=2995316 RepID=UPI00248D0FE9|nr:hypothetical protein [Flammeovirga sp. SubArs3]
MIFNKYRSIIAALAVAFLASCTIEVDDFQPSAGTDASGNAVDFTTYVALGNSLTAGYTDGAWVAKAQANSYPQLIANSLQSVNLGANGFTQPLVSNSSKAYFGTQLVLTNAGPSALPTINVDGARASDNITPGTYHNMAVPGIRAVDMAVPGYGVANPLFGYFSSEATATVLNDAAAANATFFSVWLGANDVLGFATSGGSLGSNDILQATAITPVETYQAAMTQVLETMSANGANGVILNIPNIMEAALFNFMPSDLEGVLGLAGVPFTEDILALVNGFMASTIGDAKNPTITAVATPSIDPGDGELINAVAAAAATAPSIDKDPNVPSDLAYTVIFLQLTTDPENPLSPADAMTYLASVEGQTQIAGFVGLGLNITWAQMNAEQAIADSDSYMQEQGTYPVFTMESNQMPYYDATSPTGMRQSEVGTKFTLTAQGKITALVGVIVGGGDLPEDLQEVLPVPANGEALIASDVEAVETAIGEYNEFLKSEADARGFAYVDTRSIMHEAVTGIIIDGVTYTTEYLSGNLFSLDGAHLTQRGYAVIANYTIEAINNKYGAKIPTVQQNDYPVVEETAVPAPAN